MGQLDTPRPIGVITGDERAKAAIRSLKDYGLQFWPEPAEPYSEPEWYVLREQVNANLRGEYGPGYRDASQHVIELERDLPAEQIATEITKKEMPVDDATKKRPAYDRDHKWLRWHEDDGIGPTEIRDKWNALTEADRKAITAKKWQTINPGASGRVIVDTALKRAGRERKLA